MFCKHCGKQQDYRVLNFIVSETPYVVAVRRLCMGCDGLLAEQMFKLPGQAPTKSPSPRPGVAS